MRRLLFALPVLAALAVFGPLAPSGAEEGKGFEETLTITKVVEGDGPTGGYVIEYSCTSTDEGAGGSGGALAFDAAGPGSPETQTVEVENGDNCIVTETDSNGAASTTYACEVTFPSDVAPGEGGTRCVDDQTVLYLEGARDVDGHITVTNTFEADVDPGNEEPPPAVQPDVVNATPAFTG